MDNIVESGEELSSVAEEKKVEAIPGGDSVHSQEDEGSLAVSVFRGRDAH